VKESKTMPEGDQQQQQQPAANPGTPAGNPGGQGDGQPQTFTRDQVEEKLRGQGKALKEALAQLEAERAQRAELEAAQRAAADSALAEQGKFKELFEKTEAEKKALEEQHNALVARETARVEALTKANKERRKALPDPLTDLIPSGLSPDAEAEHLVKLEKHLADLEKAAGTAPGNGAFSSGVRPPGQSQTEEQRLEALRKRAADAQLGRKPSNDRGVQR
jgi:hypothetical protein